MTSHIQLHHTNTSRPVSKYTGTTLPFYVYRANIGNDVITRCVRCLSGVGAIS
jgi:hypothetical protein